MRNIDVAAAQLEFRGYCYRRRLKWLISAEIIVAAVWCLLVWKLLA